MAAVLPTMSYANFLISGKASNPEQQSLLTTLDEDSESSTTGHATMVPSNVSAAALSLFSIQHGRPAASDEEAMDYVRTMVAARSTTPVSLDRSSNAPPNVQEAAHNIYQSHHGRRAATAAEAIQYAQSLVSKVKRQSHAQQPADLAAPTAPDAAEAAEHEAAARNEETSPVLSTTTRSTFDVDDEKIPAENVLAENVLLVDEAPVACTSCGYPVCTFDRTCSKCGKPVLPMASVVGSGEAAGRRTSLDVRCDAWEQSSCCRLFATCFGATPCAIRRALRATSPK